MILNKPYIWLKGYPTTELMRLHFKVSLGSDKKLSAPTINDDLTINTRFLTYDIIEMEGTYSNEYAHDLDESTNFDPSTTDYITVVIREARTSGGTVQKGKGTVNTTEADSSGDDEDSLLRPFLKLWANT